MNTRYSAIALALLGCSVSAEETANFKQLLAMDLGEMLKVEVATGTAKQLSEAPAVVSVITAEDIRVTGARTLAEAVERVPGLHVAISVNRGSNNFAVRGIQTDNTPQILILLDDVEISELSAWPTPYAFSYPVNAIERIEIIRGPGSAVYGADAFSGVINIITKQPEGKNQVEVGVNAGSFKYREAWLNADFTIKDVGIGLSVTHDEQGNDSDRITPYGVMDRRKDTENIHLNLKYGQFALRNWYYHSEKQMGIGAGIIGNEFDRDITQAWKTQLNWDGSISENLTGTFDLSYGESRFDALFQLFPPGVWPIGPDGNFGTPPSGPVSFPEGIIGQPQGNTTRTKLNAAVIYSGFENHRLRIGFGGENSELTDVREFKNFGPGVLDLANIPADPDGPDGPLFPISDTIVDVSGTPFVYTPDYERDLKYISIQDEWKFADNWELTAGFRYDDFSDFGSTTNPRLALVWNTTETFTSKFLYGTAFRAPRVSELAFVNNPTVLGNQNLQPEKIETIELAFDFRPNKNFSGLLNIFKYESEDLIQLDQGFTFQNIGEQDGEGIEIETNWQATSELRINASLSWLNSELPLSDEDKAQFPGFMGHIDIRYQFAEEWLFTMQNYWITERKRQLGDSRPEVGDYVKTDITLLWQTESAWTARLGIKNIFDEELVEPLPNSPLFGVGLGFPDDFPLESRAVFGSLTYTF